MADFLQKIQQGAKQHTFDTYVGGGVEKFQKLQLLDKSVVNLTERQVPQRNPLVNYNVFSWPASGQYSRILIDGGQLNVFLTERSGTGPCAGIPYLRMAVVGDAATDSVFVPAPLWIQTLQCNTPSSTPYQNHDGSGLWYSLIETEDNDEWENEMRCVGASITYEKGFPIDHGRTTVFLIPLVGNLLGMGFFTPSVKGQMPFNFMFWPETVTKISGPSVTVSYVSLDVKMEQMSPEALAAAIQYRKSNRVTYVIPYERVQRIRQAWTASLLYPITLNGFSGDGAVFRFLFRLSMIGRDLFTEQPIASFQILNSAGNPITGTQVIDDTLNRHKQQKEWTLGTASTHHFKYLFVWAAAKQGFLSMLLNGIKYGAYYFNNNEVLNVTTEQAGTDEVLSLQYNNPAIPAGGTFILQWSTPQGGTCESIPIAFGTTAADVKAKIEAIANFQGTVNVTGSAAANWVIEFTGHYGNRPMFARGYQMLAISSADNAGNLQTPLRVIVQTPGVKGITSGATMVLDMHLYTTAFITQEMDETMSVGIQS